MLPLAAGLFPVVCWAQAARAPGPAASGAVKVNAPAASAAQTTAMERAQRAADSPLRAILEAAKLRRRVEADARPEGQPTAARAPVSRASPGEPTRLDTAAQAVGPVTAPAPARAAPAVEPESSVVTIRTLPSEALPVAPARSAGLTPSAVVPLRSASAPQLAADLPRPTRLPALADSALRPPELVHMVEPEMTPRLLDLLVRPEVAVEFIIRPDGSVIGVQVQPPVPRAIVPVIAAAVEQWRFAPLPASRPHRVQLVFKPGGS